MKIVKIDHPRKFHPAKVYMYQVSSIKYSYLDWGTVSQGLLLVAPRNGATMRYAMYAVYPWFYAHSCMFVHPSIHIRLIR